MRYVSTTWEKFPSFVEYANEQRHFLVLTSDALQWAHRLAIPLVGGGRIPWSPEQAWEQLRAHQSLFQAFLQALIAGRPTQQQMDLLTTHCNHIVLTSSWDSRPEAVRIAEVQRYNDPAVYEASRQKRLAQGRAPLAAPPQPRTPLPRYSEMRTPQDPLDGVYWDLREFLQQHQPKHLQRCPACRQFFVQATARDQTYCGTTCRLKANPTRRAKNSEYVKRHREGKIRADLQRIREAKKTLGSCTGTDILNATGINKRRWNTLQKWEVEQYGHPKVTALMGDA